MLLQLGEWFEVVAAALSRMHSLSDTHSQHTRTEPDNSRSTSAPLHKGATPSNFETIPEMSSSSIIWRQSRPPSATLQSNTPNVPFKTARSNSVTSQPSSRQSRLLEHPHTRSTPTSRATTRLDWYQLLQEVKLDDMSLSSWFGYGGLVRRHVEMDDSTIINISPAFGCILVRDSKAQNIPEQLKVACYTDGVPPL